MDARSEQCRSWKWKYDGVVAGSFVLPAESDDDATFNVVRISISFRKRKKEKCSEFSWLVFFKENRKTTKTIIVPI